MRGVPNPELKAECIRLRVEERLSLRDIHGRTGASKGSLSTWLKDHPLTSQEKAERQARNRYRAPKKDRGEPSSVYALVRDREYTRHQKAKIAESAVLFRLALFQLDPFGSMFDGDRADWVVEVPGTGNIVKIQVKWARAGKTGLPMIRLLCGDGSHRQRRYQEGEFHFLVGYDLFTDTCYVWSWAEVAHLKYCVTIHPDAAERWDKIIDMP